MVKTVTKKTKEASNDKLIYLRNDVIIPFNRIDIIIKTTKNPANNEQWSSPRWIVYLVNDSMYKYITLTEEEFSKHIKKLL